MKKMYQDPRDRGESDYYYGRPRMPHHRWVGSEGVVITETEEDMTPEQIAEYHAGYDEFEKRDIRKEY